MSVSHCLPIPGAISSLLAIIRRHRLAQSPETAHPTLTLRLLDVFTRTWDLGFVAFGGPPVHFRILYQRFVEGGRKGDEGKWCDEQTYQELFAICQGLPGPGSTKMIFCLALLHAGFIPALFTFLIWSLPGAIGMYAFSLGVQRINEVLPRPVYALLSGLNSATVGIIALAGVQLAEKAIKDKLTRILVIFGACAGLCYNALWYFPLIMAVGGLTTVMWDGWMYQWIEMAKVRSRRKSNPEGVTEEIGAEEVRVAETPVDEITAEEMEPFGVRAESTKAAPTRQSTAEVETTSHVIRVKVGIAIAVGFFASFIAVLVARGVLTAPPLALKLFAAMYLAGTVIFGGGPVVIPLLRSYVVDPGWVSGRDFLLGLAIIQAFPGPNFNFGVYLGALSMQRSEFPTILGAFLGFVGLFAPGVTLAVAVQSFWHISRTRKWVADLLRGVNATAVGLVFTAVYRLWEIGYLKSGSNSGQSLGLEPWWVVIAAITYAESAWFKVPPAAAIVMGAVLGLCWYGAVGRRVVL